MGVPRTLKVAMGVPRTSLAAMGVLDNGHNFNSPLGSMEI